MIAYFAAIFWNFKKIFTQKNWGQIIVGLAYLAILLLLFVGVYFAGLQTFRFLYSFSEVSAPIVRYILLTSLAFAAIISTLSFVITLSARLFAKTLAVYFLAPNSPTFLFQAIFVENFFLGGWPFLILVLPLLLAYLAVSGAGITHYLFLLILLAFLIILTESMGALIAILFRHYFGQASKKLIYLVSFATLLLLAIFLKKIFLPAGLSEIAERPTLKEVFLGLSSLPVAIPWLPPALFLESLSPKFTPFLIFTLQAALSYGLTLLAVGKFYRRTWQKAQEGTLIALPQQPVKHTKPVIFRGELASLFKKEYLIIDRSPSLIIYFAFVVFLALVFFFLLSQSPRSPEFSPALFSKIIAFTLMVIGYLVTMIALRFSFPSLVWEFPKFWSLVRLPGRFKILLAKWLAYTFLTVGAGWIFGILAFFLLRLPFDLLLLFLVFCLSSAFFIGAVNLALGVIYAPKLPREDIEQATTALPAVLATLLSILIVILAGFAFYQFLRVSPGGEVSLVSSGSELGSLFIVLGLSVFFSFLAFTWVRKKFVRMDIR